VTRFLTEELKVLKPMTYSCLIGNHIRKTYPIPRLEGILTSHLLHFDLLEVILLKCQEYKTKNAIESYKREV
jgi:hypothetical protein